MSDAANDVTQRVAAMLSQLWEQHKPEIVSRVDLLEQTLAPSMDPDTRDAARRAAHKLAGSLGTFGLQDATEKAREIERMFDAGEPSAEDIVRARENVEFIRAAIASKSV